MNVEKELAKELGFNPEGIGRLDEPTVISVDRHAASKLWHKCVELKTQLAEAQQERNRAQTILRGFCAKHTDRVLIHLNDDSDCPLCSAQENERLKERECRSAEQQLQQMRTALQHIPKSYQGKLGYDFNEKTRMFNICTDGYGVAQTEDSEVAHAICVIFNVLLGKEGR